GGNKGDGVLDLVLEVLRERPVPEPQAGPGTVESGVADQRQAIQTVAKIGEPRRVLHDAIEQVAVGDPQPFALQRYVLRLEHDFDSAEVLVDVLPRERI